MQCQGQFDRAAFMMWWWWWC